MQTGNTDKPRLGYAKGGQIRCMAEGGLISNLVSKLRPKTSAERYAEHEAAQQVAKPAPAPATPSAAPLVRGTLDPKNALQAREKAAGLAKGGKVEGPGGPTGDQIPIMASDGEFMIKAAAVKKLGVPTLEALNAVADGDKPRLGKVKRKRRGKRKGYEQGGPIYSDGTSRTLAPYVNHRAPSGPPAMPPPLALPNNAPPPGTAVATTPYKPNFTMGATPPAVAPVDPVSDVRAKYNPANASPEAKAWQASRAPAPPQPAAAPAPAATAPAAPPPAAAPNGTGYKVGQRLGQVARSVVPVAVGANAVSHFNDYKIDDPAVDSSAGGTVAALGRGDFAGAGRSFSKGALEAGMDLGSFAANAADLVVPGNAPVSTAYNKMLRDRFGTQLVDNTGAAAAPVVPPAAAAQATRPVAAPAALPVATEPFAADPRSLTNPNAAPGFVTPAQVVRTGNSYTGAPNISGDIQIVDQGGSPRRMGGTVSNMGATAGPTPSSGTDQALFAARMAAAQRGDVEGLKASYAAQGQSFGPKIDPVDALVNNGKPMTARKAAAIAAIMQSRSQSDTATAANKLATDRFAMDREGADLSNREKKGLLSARDAYANAKPGSPEQAAAAERLRAFQGHQEKTPVDQYAAADGGTTVDAVGNTIKNPPIIFNRLTGEVKGQAQASALPTGLKVGAPSKQADGTYTNAGGTGKTVVIKGGKVTEIK